MAIGSSGLTFLIAYRQAIHVFHVVIKKCAEVTFHGQPFSATAAINDFTTLGDAYQDFLEFRPCVKLSSTTKINTTAPIETFVEPVCAQLNQLPGEHFSVWASNYN